MVHAIDLGGGLGFHSIEMAKLGASVTMVDIADTDTEEFSNNLKFIQKNVMDLTEADLDYIDVLYSQRALHYLPYRDIQKLLNFMFSHMSEDSAIFISAAGLNAEYGGTYLNRSLNRLKNPITLPSASSATRAATRLRGPHFTDSDIYITKTFPIREGIRLRLDGQFFNAFNHPNFALPRPCRQAFPSEVGGCTPARVDVLSAIATRSSTAEGWQGPPLR